MKLVLVFLGGGLGSSLRYLLAQYLNHSPGTIPYGTFLANVLGCLIIGIVLALGAKNNLLSTQATLLLATGFCGGFTTFSAFAYENMVFLKNGDIGLFLLYTFLSLALGLLAVFGGFWLVRLF